MSDQLTDEIMITIRAIKEYKGTLILVCHESEFYTGLVDEIWDVSDWSTKII